MALGTAALNTNEWSFIWNGDANRYYIPSYPSMSNPYATRYNGGFHINPSVREGMKNPLENFWIGDENLNNWIMTYTDAAAARLKPKQAAKTSPAAATTEAYQFIDTISQDTNGVITATKKTMRKATTSAPGMVQLNDNTNSTRTDHAATANAVRKAYERADAACIELGNKADAADVYTKSQVDAALAAAATNLVETVIKESTYNLTWDAEAGIMWRKVARNGAFYEQCYTNVNIIVEGNQ